MAVEVVAVDATRSLGDVRAEIGRTLDVGDDLDPTDEPAKIRRDRLLQRDLTEAELLEFARAAVVLLVTEDEVLGALEVAREQDLGGAWDQLGHAGRQPGDALVDLGRA